MSWRRFAVLLRGLSPNAATVTKLASTREFGKHHEPVNVMGTPEEAQSAFMTLFGRKPGPEGQPA